jgi:G3E family GTPase
VTAIDFIVLTGFLGSGKTTLLREFLALPEAADTGVIVNEVGQIGLDGAILAEGGETPVALLSNGCVCCSLGSDLERTVANMLTVRQDTGLQPPARIVLETSGLAKPGPVLRSLAPLAPLGMRVGVVATFDCTRGAELESFEEAAAQWAGAQTLVVTKRDLATAAQVQDMPRLAAGINPTAELIDTDDRRALTLAAFSLRSPAFLTGSLLRAEAVGLRHPRIGVVLARLDAPVAWDALAEWLDNLAGLCGERMLRVKGLVKVIGNSRPLLVQCVGTTFSAPRPFSGRTHNDSFLVVILRDANLAELSGIAPALPFSFALLGRDAADYAAVGH